MREVYLDYSATTPVKKEVLDEMLPYYMDGFGNPSSLYEKGEESKAALDKARDRVAKLINSNPSEVFFTSCGSEADNWALFGVADALKEKGNHIITTAIEHHAILHIGEFLEKHGYEMTYLPVLPDGSADPAVFEAAITDKTILASVMYVNNEIGTVPVSFLFFFPFRPCCLAWKCLLPCKPLWCSPGRGWWPAPAQPSSSFLIPRPFPTDAWCKARSAVDRKSVV